MNSKISGDNIREKILSDAYGKFDLIDTVFSKEEILTTKPRILLKNIIARFSIPAGTINRKTFWSWLLRYKKKNKGLASSPTSIFPVENSNLGKTPVHAENWRDFKPSAAESYKQSKALIKVIK